MQANRFHHAPGEAFSERNGAMPDKFRAVARRSYLDLGMPKVGREVVGLYATRKEAEDACTEYVKCHADVFRAEYDDCIVELALEGEEIMPDA
jgi:hypothetical protein